MALAPAGTPNQQLSAVAITPDGKRALVVKAAANKAALLDIDGTTVTYKGYDMTTGVFPYNVQITPDGKLGLVNNNGNGGASDGQVDTVAVIDMEMNPPRVVDQVVVGDGPEGLAVSPAGGYAASIILNGVGNVPKTAFFHHEHSYVSLLKIDGKKVRKVSETELGGLTEGVVFSPDGRYLYVGNFFDSDITILRLQGNKLVPVGSLKLAGPSRLDARQRALSVRRNLGALGSASRSATINLPAAPIGCAWRARRDFFQFSRGRVTTERRNPRQARRLGAAPDDGMNFASDWEGISVYAIRRGDRDGSFGWDDARRRDYPRARRACDRRYEPARTRLYQLVQQLRRRSDDEHRHPSCRRTMTRFSLGPGEHVRGPVQRGDRVAWRCDRPVERAAAFYYIVTVP